MNKPSRGNSFMLFLLIYMVFASGAFQILIEKNVFLNISTPVMIGLSQTILFLPPFVIYVLITKQSIKDIVPLKPLSIRNVVLILLICISAQPIASFFSALSSLAFNNDVADLMSEMSSMPFWIVALSMSVFPAVFEELMLRGIVFSNYKNVSLKKAALINGLFFGMLHLNLQQFLYAFFIGALFYCFVYYSKSIFSAMLAHFSINFSQTWLAFSVMSSAEQLEPVIETEAIKMGNEIYIYVVLSFLLMLVFLPIFVLLLRYFISYNKFKNIKEAFITKNSIYDALKSFSNSNNSNLSNLDLGLDLELELNSNLEAEQNQKIFGIAFWAVIITFTVIIALMIMPMPT